MAGSWQPLGNQPGFAADTMLLLTDGRVMCHQTSSSSWSCLTPDSSGNYVQGTWSAIASFVNNGAIATKVGGPTYAPLYFASAVLKDGRVFVAGGEYNAGNADAELTVAQVYDPVADTWTDITPGALGWNKIGDAPSCVLPDGRVLLGSIDGGATVIYDPVANAWTAAANKNDASSEETWTLLPDDTILTVQCSNSPNAEKYIVSSDKWVSASATPVPLPQPCSGLVAEIGPAILLPNGRVFAIGASGNTAVYTPPDSPEKPGTWEQGPSLGCAGPNDFVTADLEGKGNVDVVVADNGNFCAGILKWNGSALSPAWTSSNVLHGPAGDWERGNDLLISADVDADGAAEVVIANNDDLWTGVLKWNGSALVPIWMSPSPLSGPAGDWNRAWDLFVAADVDGDRADEVVIANNGDLWTGLLKWKDAGLVPVWMSPTPLSGPAGDWNRSFDFFIAADVDGDRAAEIVVANNLDRWTGVLKWIDAALVPVWMSPSPLTGPAGDWNRGWDVFAAADVDGDGQTEIVIANNTDLWTGLLKWDGAALVPVWMSPSPLTGPAGDWNRGWDVFAAADVDGDGRAEIVIANNTDLWTCVLKWNGSALAPIWMSPSPLSGPAGDWERGNDAFVAGDVDGDRQVEIVITNSGDRWIGVLKWNGSALVPLWMAPSNASLYAMDAPASLLPNGKVLCVGSPANPCDYPAPTFFFEYDPTTNSLTQVLSPTNSDGPCYTGRTLLLPSGQVLFANGTGNIEVYTPDGAPDPSWKPTLAFAPSNVNSLPGQKFRLTGTQLNGLSQAVSYGDDAQMATNYPLVRILASDGNVYYCRTFDHWTMAVATGTKAVATWFTLPTTIPDGDGQLFVVANGIASDPVQVSVVTPQGCLNALGSLGNLLQRLFARS